MLSILIPTYNYDCSALALSLRKQAEGLHAAVEILIGDDASPRHDVAVACKRLNKEPGIRSLRAPRNLGRAAVRNWLGKMASGEWLLFVDSDGMPPGPAFLRNYLQQAASGQADVVCGGIVHPSHLPSGGTNLRYRYERQAEKKHTAAARQKRPYASFRSFNFMIRRTTFLAHGFDETFHEYGYEDVLFGYQLSAAGVPIRHIDNPLLNCDLEDNPAFLKKTEEALHTLAKHKELLAERVKVSRHLSRLHRLKLRRLLETVYRMSRAPLRKNLSGRKPSLFLFNAYKLLYLNHIWG